jgi:hypothetical protein
MSRPLAFQQRPFEMSEWTWRVRERAHMLRPDPGCRDRLLGVLGRAQALYGDDFRLYYATIESTHIHLDTASRDAQVAAAVKCFIATNMAKEIQHLRGGPRGGLWAKRCRAIPVLDGQVEDRLMYLLAHGYKSNLVARIADWPGLGMLPAVLEGAKLEGTWYDRDRYQRDLRQWRRRQAAIKKADGDARRSLRKAQGPKPNLDDYATVYPVTLHPPPGWETLSEAEQRSEWARLVRQAETKYADRRRGQPLGLANVLATDPRHTPDKVAPNTPAPPVHGDPAQRRAWRTAYRRFVATCRACMAELAAGRPATFPWEAWLHPAFAGLRAEAPRDWALA